MCGIFGAIKPENTKINLATYQNILDKLFVLSESRGKEASGVAVMAGDKISVYKQALPASDLVKKNEYRELIKKSFSQAGNLAAIGHARLVTNGVQTSAGNNQPVVKNGIIIIHNGIVTNVEALWNKYKDLKREYEVDTEIIPALLHKFLNEGSNIKTAIKRIFTLVEGTISIAVFFVDYDYLMLASNNGSLYVVINKQAENVFCTFASERYILEKLIEKTNEFESGSSVITQIKPNEVRLVNLKNCQMDNSDLEKIQVVFVLRRGLGLLEVFGE